MSSMARRSPGEDWIAVVGKNGTAELGRRLQGRIDPTLVSVSG